METIKIKRKVRSLIKLGLVLLMGTLVLNCENEIQKFDPTLGEFVITEYVDDKDIYSEFSEVLYATGINNLLRVRGPFTLMLPTNEAMQAYYKRKNVSSYSEIETQELEDFVYNHLFEGEINSGTIGQGSLLYKNALGDDIACDLIGSDIQLNKSAIIIDRDIILSNGYVHVIDQTLDPIYDDIYTILGELPGYSIFTQGLELSGISDTLKTITFQYGNTQARTRYTLLAVPDTLFNRFGISTIDDLVNTYSDSDDLTSKNNGFYKYMEFHCLSGTHYFTDFDPKVAGGVYYLISYDNIINIKVAKEYRINENNDNYTGFFYQESNIPAKNGVIHTVDDLLPAVDGEPQEVEFHVTHYFDLQQGSYYGKNYARFYDGQNTFEKIKWDAEYLLYYFKNEGGFAETDGLSLSGHYWIELTLPKIRKGTYQLSMWWFGGGNTAFYIDGEFFTEFNISTSSWADWTPIENTITFDETQEHKLRIQTLEDGGLWWDRILLEPVE